MAGPVVQGPDLKSQLTKIWEAIRTLQTRGLQGLNLTGSQAMTYNNGVSNLIVIGPNPDGSISITAPSLKTVDGQRFKVFIQNADPGTEDADPGVIRVWIQA